MASELKRIKKTKQKIKQLEYESILLHLVRSISDDERDAKLAERQAERVKQLALLNEYESDYLIKTAQSWGIEVPLKDGWYAERVKDSASGTIVLVQRDWLNEVGKAVITRQIRNERFTYWKGWAEILIPILSLIVAIIALLRP